MPQGSCGELLERMGLYVVSGAIQFSYKEVIYCDLGQRIRVYHTQFVHMQSK